MGLVLLDGELGGVVVSEVSQGSQAATLGVPSPAKIVGVNGRGLSPIMNRDQLAEEIMQLGRPLTLEIVPEEPNEALSFDM